MRRDLGTIAVIDGKQYYLPYPDCQNVSIASIPGGLGDCASSAGCGIPGTMGGYTITINVTYNEFLDGDYRPGARITEDRILSLPSNLMPVSNLRWVTANKSIVYGSEYPFNLGGSVWDESNYTSTDLFSNLVYDLPIAIHLLIFDYALPQSSLPSINSISMVPYGGASSGGSGTIGIYHNGNLFIDTGLDPALASNGIILCPNDCNPDEHKVILDRNTGLFCCCKCH
jgi:hypothetical protein